MDHRVDDDDDDDNNNDVDRRRYFLMDSFEFRLEYNVKFFVLAVHQAHSH